MTKTEHVLPGDIEKTSMAIIGQELAEKGIVIPEENIAVVKRVIHTSADFDYAENLKFTQNAVVLIKKQILNSGELHPLTIVTDTNMALAGITKPTLKKLNMQAECFMAKDEIASLAKENGTTRAVASMEYAAQNLQNFAFAIGNAPTALFKISELIESGVKPAFVIGVPVGFVNVVESKLEIFDICEKYGIPAIVAMGRKGGSNVAAAICNALLYSSADTLDPAKRGWQS